MSPPSELDPEDDLPRPPQFNLRTLLALNTVLGVLFAIPWVRGAFAVTAAIFVMLVLLQLPLFFLFGAFRMQDRDRPSTNSTA